MEKITEYVKKMLKEYPKLSDKIIDLYLMAKEEIMDGSSPDNEYDLFVKVVEDEINKHKQEPVK